VLLEAEAVPELHRPGHSLLRVEVVGVDVLLVYWLEVDRGSTVRLGEGLWMLGEVLSVGDGYAIEAVIVLGVTDEVLPSGDPVAEVGVDLGRLR